MIGHIYRIIHTESDKCYIGSTSGELRFRWQVHRSTYARWLKEEGKPLSIYPLFKEHGIDKFRMILIKDYEVEDRKHLQAYEQLWINKFKKTAVNKNHSFDVKFLSKKQNLDKIKKYRADNKDKIKNINQSYYQANKAKLSAKSKEQLKVKINCGCGGIFSSKTEYIHVKGKKHMKWAEQN